MCQTVYLNTVDEANRKQKVKTVKLSLNLSNLQLVFLLRLVLYSCIIGDKHTDVPKL